MITSTIRRWGLVATVASSLVVSVGGIASAGASQKTDESTTTTTAPITTTTSAAPTTTTSTLVPSEPHDTAWAQLTASRGKLAANSGFSDFQVIHFASSQIPPGSPISYNNSDGQISVKESGYYQVSFSVFATRNKDEPFPLADQVTEWGLGGYGLTAGLKTTPLTQCVAPSNWYPFPNSKTGGDMELYSYVASRTCIVQLESKYKYGLFKLSQGAMELDLPQNLNGRGGSAYFAAPASLTINLLDATP
jgi:hypothetical protein